MGIKSTEVEGAQDCTVSCIHGGGDSVDEGFALTDLRKGGRTTRDI